METRRKILWGSAGIVLVAVIIVSLSSNDVSEKASLIPELAGKSSSPESTTEKIVWDTTSSAEPFLTESEITGIPFTVQGTSKVICTAMGKVLGGGSTPLDNNEAPNHLIIDFSMEKATQCVRGECKTVDIRFQNLDGTPLNIYPLDIREDLDIRLYTEGKYRDYNPDKTYYYGSCSAL